MVAEAVAVGAVASAAGVGGGIAIATALKALFKATGFDALPDRWARGAARRGAGRLRWSASPWRLLAGRRAGDPRRSRVPPLAALRETAVEATAVVSPARVVGRGRLDR